MTSTTTSMTDNFGWNLSSRQMKFFAGNKTSMDKKLATRPTVNQTDSPQDRKTDRKTVTYLQCKSKSGHVSCPSNIIGISSNSPLNIDDTVFNESFWHLKYSICSLQCKPDLNGKLTSWVRTVCPAKIFFKSSKMKVHMVNEMTLFHGKPN